MPYSDKKFGLYDQRFEHDSCGVGFVCSVDGKRSNEIVKQGIGVLKRLAHRGATGADPKTGDGAGILIQIPHEFFKKAVKIDLPKPGKYATGLVFLPTGQKEREFCRDLFKKFVEAEGQKFLGWRQVPVDDSDIGVTARNTQPVIEQVFIGSTVADQLQFERKLYLIRKQIENEARAKKIWLYITNLSSRTISYKGLLMPSQVEGFFTDLKDDSFKSAICLVHSRYSTNTFPTWDLSQPFRFIAHNGEINTLRGNINWMRAREGQIESEVFGKDIRKIKPVIVPGGSDSAAIDNVFELLALSGRTLPHAMMMLIPQAWEHNDLMDKKLRDFYKFHACFMEPWDGPAAIAFTDGTRIGAVLDRNGLRPARYIVTGKGVVVMASEVGVLDIAPKDIAFSGRLEPGKMLYIDTEQGRIISDEEIKSSISSSKPYAAWLEKEMLELSDLPKVSVFEENREDLTTLLNIFGYTREDLKFILKPMAEKAKEPVGSMGNDTPHAIFSKEPQLLYNYFKQLFAQVTNPPIDPIREEIVMSMESYIGPQDNMLDEGPKHCCKLRLKLPVLTNEQLEKIRAVRMGGLRTKTISMLFRPSSQKDFSDSIERVCRESEDAINKGYTFIVLSDRGADRGHAAIPALLAVSAVHQYLIRKALRTRVGIIAESAEARETHHFALLFGYGADAVNPYLAYEAVSSLAVEGEITIDAKTAVSNYIKAVISGVEKILSKMGISTLNSYRGSQIFEALGLNDKFIDGYFEGTPSRIGGAGMEEIAKETIIRHSKAYEDKALGITYLPTGGVYQWKRDGEFHLWNPETIAALQDAVRNNDRAKYTEFSRLINDQSKNPTTLRSLIKISKSKTRPIPIEEVEPVQSILKRFAVGAMSFGSISRSAHETIAIAMNRIGGRSNTGEGGEDPLRFKPLPNGDLKRSAIKQVASGRFGVTANYLVNADEIQIKMAQGAKPGEGGQLPGHKVSEIIAKTRYTTPGVTLISPPPHHDIYSIEDLAQLIFDLKNINPRARISVKLVSEVGVGTIAAGVAKGHADMILISGGDGGTGASPVSSIKNAGLPWELGLSETHQTLMMNNLRSRVRLQTDGQMRTGRDVAIAAMLGAEEFGFCTAVLIVLGCVMLRHCHLNNCSVGVATQDEELSNRFTGKPEYIINYFTFIAQELRGIMAGIGVASLDKLIGRSDLLETDKTIVPWKAKDIDYSRVFYRPESSKDADVRCTTLQVHGIDKVLDKKLIEMASSALKERSAVRGEVFINNTNRTTGAMLSGELCRIYGEEGLPEDTIQFKFSGVAGQSFGAWLAKGVTLELEGMANDYVGKGISGGKIIVYPSKESTYASEKNIIIGNTTFYGAISGQAYIRGVAGERFCIRNSGLDAVVEGVGDHGCEYMTGGHVVVLGGTGRNFGAGMSGGIAYVYDRYNDFAEKCNLKMVGLEKVSKEDKKIISSLINNHYRHTKSPLAKKILDNFENEMRRFVKVMPMEYKRVLAGLPAGRKEKELAEESGLTEVLDG
jgi:glutamate synthase domain-containing protein 2/glutamate synthase domain-containing protein 1/glutamate synthase domain-containing protein 3